jgi:hypothetical protein
VVSFVTLGGRDLHSLVYELLLIVRLHRHCVALASLVIKNGRFIAISFGTCLAIEFTLRMPSEPVLRLKSPLTCPSVLLDFSSPQAVLG